MATKANRKMLKCILIIMLAFVILFVSVTGYRLTTIMLINGEKYQSLASEQQLYDTLITAPRGDILDSKMNLLATSDTAYTIYIIPNSINNLQDENKKTLIKTTIAKGISEILEIDFETALGYTEKKTSYVTVKKRVDKGIADRVRQFITDNKDLGISKYIGIDETTKRYYPNDSLASVVLGFVGDDNQGLAGIESYYDAELTGVTGRVVAAKNALGADMPFSYQVVEEAKQGNSLVLTIDSYLQHVAEKYLEQAVEANRAGDRGACVIMDVNTGAIRAMATKGDFNPNSPFTLSETDQALLDAEGSTYTKNELLNKQWRNKTVSDTYEPGSVFKIVTGAMALEEDLATLESSYNCAWSIVIAGQVYHCHKKGGHGTQTLKEAMVHSCNPAFITVGQLVGVSKFSKYFEAFGLTKKTGIDLPGESISVYHSEKNMGPTELASSSFGQTFNITPIQLITAVSAAVNGGNLVKPYVVSQVLDYNNNVIKSTQTIVKRQVISEETSKKIRIMMQAVIEDGGAKNAYVAGFKTGAKTGTSEKVAQNNASGEVKYIASTVGIAPVDDPEIAVLVMIDEPNGGSYYGGAVAAPVVSEILTEAMPYLGYEPQYTDKELAQYALNIPSVINDDIATAKNKIVAAGLKTRIIGNGEKVLRQLPLGGQSLAKGGTVILYTEEGVTEELNATVPNFNGMTVSEANNSASAAGLNIEFTGNISSNGYITAYKQSLDAGTQVPTGTIVTVYFRDTSAANVAD